MQPPGGVRRALTRREVEVAVGYWVLETAHSQIGGGDVCGRGSEHFRTLVDADQFRLWVEVEHPAGRLPRADAELENPLGVDSGVRLGAASCSSSYAGTSLRIVSR